MGLDLIAEKFQAAGIASLVFDNRNFGASDGLPRQEADPSRQSVDYYEAVTFLVNTPGVDASKIATWGYSLSGGYAIKAGAIDSRVKAVITICPMLSTHKLLQRMVPAHLRASVEALLFAERTARMRGDEPAYGVVASEDPAAQAIFMTASDVDWLSTMQKTKAPAWENRYTIHTRFDIQSYHPTGLVEALSPTPWLLIQGDADQAAPPDLNMEMFAKAFEPKELVMFEGGHFTPFAGNVFEDTMAAEIDFLKRKLKFGA